MHISSILSSYYVKIKNSEKNLEIECPNHQVCHGAINKEHIFEIIRNEETLKKYFDVTEKVFIIKSKNHIFCPIPNCDSHAVKDSYNKCISVLKCIKYKHEFCVKCLKPSHNGVKCSKQEVIVDKKIAQVNNMKKCPKCQLWIQKVDGCNHMTCENLGCGYEFCWICEEQYTADHYSNPLSQCFKLSNEDVSNSYLNNKYIRFLRCFGLCILGLLLVGIVCCIFSIVGIVALSLLIKEEFYEVKINKFNRKSAKVLYYFLYFSTYLILGIAFYSLGLVIAAILIVTSPIWIVTLTCIKKVNFYFDQSENRVNEVVNERPIVNIENRVNNEVNNDKIQIIAENNNIEKNFEDAIKIENIKILSNRNENIMINKNNIVNKKVVDKIILKQLDFYSSNMVVESNLMNKDTSLIINNRVNNMSF
jgi:hypothetical protein